MKAVCMAVMMIGVLALASGCTALTNTAPGGAVPLADLGTTATYDVLGPAVGTSTGGYLFGFIPVGMDNKSGAIATGTPSFYTPVQSAAIYNAIVVIENIDRHRQLGKAPFDAAYDGTKEVWGAIIASTLTTIAVFLPVVFVQDEAGQLFRDIAIAVVAAVTLSLFVSMTVIPMFSFKLFSNSTYYNIVPFTFRTNKFHFTINILFL